MNRIFIGYDPRQAVSYNVLQHSIAIRSTKPVAITPLIIEQLPLKRTGLTPFTFSRFLVPYLCDYKGWALFLDADMLLMDDINKLFDLADPAYTVMVAKNEKRFEWASAILFNCEKCTMLTPSFIETAGGLHTFEFLKPEEVGGLPPEWNHLVGYDKPRPDPKLIHYTQGVPAWPETAHCEHARAWESDARFMVSAQPWETLMGRSVHAQVHDGKLKPKLATA